MPDRRRHRGRHPSDVDLFAPATHDQLRAATYELSWLLGRGYSDTAAVALVGNRHTLRARQRAAILRAACSDAARAARRARAIEPAAAAGRPVVLDGFNCVIAIEAAMSGGVIVIGRDGAYRDLSSVHGSYRRVAETRAAIDAVADVLAAAAPSAITWYLDQPVSNSGRLAELIRDVGRDRELPWEAHVVLSPDRELASDTERVVATGDSVILDACGAWLDIPRAVIEARAIDCFLVDLRDPRA